MPDIKKIDAFTLKLIMVVLMILDHSWRFLDGLPYWFHIASRIVFPVFIFLMTESLNKTSNQLRYIKRLYIFGFVTSVCKLTVTYIYYLKSGEIVFTSYNMILALAVCANILYLLDRAFKPEDNNNNIIKLNNRVVCILTAIPLTIISVCYLEGKYLTLISALIFFYLRFSPILMGVTYAAASLALNGLTVQALMGVAVIPVLFYNGKRGLDNKFFKYFFYIIYPLHLSVLYIIKYIL